MSKPNLTLTPWFPGDVKPARVGVYERAATAMTDPYSFWNGKEWLCSNRTQKGAALEDSEPFVPSVNQRDPWRGLANNPKAKK